MLCSICQGSLQLAASTKRTLGTRLAWEQKDKEDDVLSSKLFTCPIDGCIKMYQQQSNLESHILYGECQLVAEKLNLLDKAKVLNREKLLHGSNSVPSLSSCKVPAPQLRNYSLQGWALKGGKQTKRFSEKQKIYLDQNSTLDKKLDTKLDGVIVSQDMRYTKDNEGDNLIDASQFLTAQQISSYFSRMA